MGKVHEAGCARTLASPFKPTKHSTSLSTICHHLYLPAPKLDTKIHRNRNPLGCPCSWAARDHYLMCYTERVWTGIWPLPYGTLRKFISCPLQTRQFCPDVLHALLHSTKYAGTIKDDTAFILKLIIFVFTNRSHFVFTFTINSPTSSNQRSQT